MGGRVGVLHEVVGQRSRCPAGSREGGQGRVGRGPGPGSQAYNGQSAWLVTGIQHVPYGTRWTSGATHARHWPRGALGPRLAVQWPWCRSGHLGEVSCRYLQASDSEWPLGCGHGGSYQGLQSSRDWRAKPGPQGRQPHGLGLGPGGAGSPGSLARGSSTCCIQAAASVASHHSVSDGRQAQEGSGAAGAPVPGQLQWHDTPQLLLQA